MQATLVLWDKHMRKFLRSRFELVASLAIPLLLMGLFGVTMSRVMINFHGNLNYIAYITPGVVAFTALTACILGGATLLAERMNGAIKEYLVAPIPRLAVLVAAMGSGTAKATVESAIIVLVAIALGARPTAGGAAGWLVAVAAFLLFTVGFAAVTVAAAAGAHSSEVYHSSVTLLNVPLLFGSNALYPLGSMPLWLRALAYVNPTTYFIDALLTGWFGQPSQFGRALDLGVLALFAVLALLLADRVFRRSVR